MSIDTIHKEFDVTISVVELSADMVLKLEYHIASLVPDDKSTASKRYFAQVLLKSVGTELVNSKGKLTKRILNAMYKEWNVTPDSDWTGRLGNIVKDLYTNNENMNLWIEQSNEFDRDPDYFVNGGSCWWQGYTTSRGLLYGTGGFGLVERDGKHGESRSRVWVVPHNDGYVLFNEYGDLTTAQWVAVATEILFEKDTKVYNKSVKMTSDASEQPYINSDGEYVSKDKTALDATEVSIDWCQTYVYYFGANGECFNCGEYEDEDDLIFSEHTGEQYCESCYSELFTCCEDCNSDGYRDNMYCVHNRRGWEVYVCESCLSDYTQCYDCEEYFHYDNTQSIDDGYYTVCDECARDYQACTHCGEKYSDSELTSYDDVVLCSSCDRDHTTSCTECDKNVYDLSDDKVEDDDGNVYCSQECLDKSEETEEE